MEAARTAVELKFSFGNKRLIRERTEAEGRNRRAENSSDRCVHRGSKMKRGRIIYKIHCRVFH